MSEKVTVKVERSVLHLPAIALRGLVVFPNNLLHFEVGREKSIAAVEWAVSNNSDVFLVAQKEMKVEDPKAADLYTYGVVAEVKQVMRVSDDLVRILVEGKYRAKLSEMEDDGSFLLATVRPAPVKMAKPEELPEADVLVRNVKKSFDDLLALNPHIGKDVVFAITTSTDAAFLSEYIPANLLFRFEDKQAILDEGTLMGRLHLLIEKMHRERRMLEIDKEIAQKVDEAMDKNQRDYYLHEQLHMISEELGEDASILEDYNSSNNPLRNSYILTLKDSTQAEETISDIEMIEGVANVRADEAVISKLIQIQHVFNIVALAMVVGLAVISIFIISNTVKLAMFARREEISIQKMVGATNAFIRLPFIVEGFIIGIIAAAVGFFLEWGLYDFVLSKIAQLDTLKLFVLTPFTDVIEIVAAAYAITGFLVGVFGSLLSIRKFLKV